MVTESERADRVIYGLMEAGRIYREDASRCLETVGRAAATDRGPGRCVHGWMWMEGNSPVGARQKWFWGLCFLLVVTER
jgi:hypothetical protein